jgi:hypothetical protein
MNSKQRPEDPRVSGSLVEGVRLLSIIPMKWLKNLWPPFCGLKRYKRVLQIAQEAADPSIETPKQDRCSHTRRANQAKNYRVHGTELYRRRSGQQNAKNDQVMIEAGNTLLGNHVEVPPSAVILFKCGHLNFLHNV